MRALLAFFVIVLVTLPGCREPKVSEAPVHQKMPGEELKSGDIGHSSLTAAQLKKIRRIHNVFSEVISSSLNETFNAFSRPGNRDHDIEVWAKMADAYERFALNLHVEEHDKKEEAFQLILLTSTVGKEDAVRRANAQYLTKEEIKEIFRYYDAPPQPTAIILK